MPISRIPAQHLSLSLDPKWGWVMRMIVSIFDAYCCVNHHSRLRSDQPSLARGQLRGQSKDRCRQIGQLNVALRQLR